MSRYKVLILNDEVNHIATVMSALCDIFGYSPDKSKKTAETIGRGMGMVVATYCRKGKALEKAGKALALGLTVRVGEISKNSQGIK